MPDSFFSTKTRKRKRVTFKDSDPSSSSRKALKTSKGRVFAKGKEKTKTKKKAHTTHDDLGSDDSGSESLDDLVLSADEVDPNESGEEDADETPAEKRLRLAKLYLESVKESLGVSHTPLLILLLWYSHSGFSAQ